MRADRGPRHSIAGPGGAEEGDLDITDDVDIEGAGAALTIVDGLPDENVFQINDPVNDGYPLLQIFDVTITGGELGALITNGELYLWRSVVEENQGRGGIRSSLSTILVVDSVIRNNVAVGSDRGGGIGFSLQGVLWVLRSTIVDNQANNRGGGLSCQLGSATLTNATVTANSQVGTGTAGGFHGDDCDILITGSTLAGNLESDLELQPQFPGAATVRNTYIGSPCPIGTASGVTSEGGNVGSPDCALNHPSDIDFAGGTAILLPLGDYGGYTPTMPPFGVGYNPLVDNPGADPNCLSDDQRGVTRPQDGWSGTAVCDTSAWSNSVP